MKIAFYNLTTTIKSGGIETFNREMARVLAKRGHTVHIIGGSGHALPNLPSGIPVHTYPFIRRGLFPNLGTRFRRFMERLSFGLFALRGLVKGKYDCIYLIKPYDIPAALLASGLTGAKVVFGSSGTEFFPGYAQLVRKVDYFFACSEFNASQIEQHCGLRPPVLHNGVDTELFCPMSPDRELKDMLGVKEGDIVVTTVGRLVGLKGIRYAVGAVAALIKKGYPVKYFIIGEGEERMSLASIARSLNAGERIRFLGNIENSALPRYYSLASIALFPSLTETFPISIEEAMACSVPVVSTDVGGIPELVKDTGIIVPSRDEEALVIGIEELLTDGDMRERLGAEGRKRIEQYFSWDIIAEKFERYIGVG